MLPSAHTKECDTKEVHESESQQQAAASARHENILLPRHHREEVLCIRSESRREGSGRGTQRLLVSTLVSTLVLQDRSASR
ncbi:hypothetical protein CesoFtcFv8_025111 [Champsocephalus esox]|uniref:Uncharacterized protein n=1 Tax=Champsocephalus esox TaxID=159716 RepID=A0AAN8B3W7_9TELE|nr:hypothetical protein CesoFtcFv8_025111 [Champsocephalus esox]